MSPTAMYLLLFGAGMVLLPTGTCQCVSVTFPNVLNLGTCLGGELTNCSNSTEGTTQGIRRLFACLLSTFPEIGSPIGVLSNIDTLMELVYANLGIPLDVESLSSVLCSPLGFPLFNCGLGALNFDYLTCGPPIEINLPASFNFAQCMNTTLLNCAPGSQFPASSLSGLLRTFECVLEGASTELQRNLSRMLACPLMDVLSSSVGQFVQLLPFRSFSRGISISIGWLMDRLAGDSCPLQARRTSLSLLGFGRRPQDGLTPTWRTSTGTVGGIFGSRPQPPAFGPRTPFRPSFGGNQLNPISGTPGFPGSGQPPSLPSGPDSGGGLGGPRGMGPIPPTFQGRNFGEMPGISGNGLPRMTPQPPVLGGGQTAGIPAVPWSGGGGSPPPPQFEMGPGFLAGTIRPPFEGMPGQGVSQESLPVETRQFGAPRPPPQFEEGDRENMPWQRGQGAQQGEMNPQSPPPFNGPMGGTMNPSIPLDAGGIPQLSAKYQRDPYNGMPWSTSMEGTSVLSQQPSQPQDGRDGGMFGPRPGTSHDPAPPINYEPRQRQSSGSSFEGGLPSSRGNRFGADPDETMRRQSLSGYHRDVEEVASLNNDEKNKIRSIPHEEDSQSTPGNYYYSGGIFLSPLQILSRDKKEAANSPNVIVI